VGDSTGRRGEDTGTGASGREGEGRDRTIGGAV